MQTIHIKKFLKQIFSLLLLVSVVTLFSGCYDLGKFGDIEEYYSTFGNVRLINQEGDENGKDYSFQDYFYNKQSVNDFSGDIVNPDEYIYFILPVEKDFNLAEFSLYIKPENSGVVHYSLFVLDLMPQNVRRYLDPKIKQIKDDDGNIITEEIVYGDPLSQNSVYESSVEVVLNKWTPILIKMSKSQVGKNFYVNRGEYLAVRFENNSGLGKDKGYEKISFSLTNVLIRAV